MRAADMFQFTAAVVDQVIADVRAAVGLAQRCRARPREVDGAVGHLFFGQPACFGDRLNHMAIAVATGEIHAGIGGDRVAAQGAFDHAHRFDELAPVQRAQQAQAADAIADRDLVSRLLLIAGADQLLDVETRIGQLLFDPGQRQA